MVFAVTNQSLSFNLYITGGVIELLIYICNYFKFNLVLPWFSLITLFEWNMSPGGGGNEPVTFLKAKKKKLPGKPAVRSFKTGVCTSVAGLVLIFV